VNYEEIPDKEGSMHWFVWLLIILMSANIVCDIAKMVGWEPQPNKWWSGLLIDSLLLAGIIVYLT